MDFSLDYSKNQEKFAKGVREWISKNIPKKFKAPCDPVKVTREEWLWRRQLALELGRMGWLYPEYPAEYGGGGLDAEKSFVLYEEFSEIGLSFPPIYDTAILAIPAIMGFGTEKQKKRFLHPILAGKVNTWQLFTEPEAGSDEANQQTNALRSTREGDYFIINGGKIFVGGVHTPPDQFWTLTRSDTKAPRHQNLATFLIPANLPGITITPLDLFDPGDFNIVSGRTPSSAHGAKHQVFFDDVKVHESYLIGGERDGWRVVNMSLALEHSGGMGAVMRGRPRNLVAEKVIEQCRTNTKLKKRLAENPSLVDSVVEIFIGGEIQRLWNLRNSWAATSGTPVPGQGPQLGILAKEYGSRIATEMAKVLGPYALTDDDKWSLSEGTFEVAERGGICFAPGGTPEIMKLVLSRGLGIGAGK